MPIPTKRLLPLLLLALLAGCDRVEELVGLPDPQKAAAEAEAEGRAVGGACRLAGRSLEDCFVLNAAVRKAFVLAGWKEMNDYMTQNNVAVVPSHLATPAPQAAAPAAEPSAPAAQTAGHAEDDKKGDSPLRHTRR